MNKFFILGLLSFLSVAKAQTCDFENLKWMGLPYDKDENFHEECRPQILYSWISGPEIIDQSDYKWALRKKPSIFLFRSPLGTALYGKFSYRVKLKAGVKFKIGPWDEAHYNCVHPEKEKKNTVYVNQDPNGFSEYVLCSPEPVESWSFAMEEHLNEMKRERDLIIKKGAKNVDGFLNPNSKKYGCKTCFQGYTIHDARNDGSKKTIDASISLMEEWVKAKKGKVYNLSDKKGFSEGEEVERHFESEIPFPFHRDF